MDPGGRVSIARSLWRYDFIPDVCHIYAMRTTLDLDDDLMEALMARHPQLTKTKAVEAAIEDHVRRGAANRLLRLRGKLEIEDVSIEMRAIDRRI